ncbi:membrane transporter [Kwoniella heveanensis CBS 569]|uniref:Membrane transporter n=1 Tax=Kwoniella heveanensis BCC8398 TaxID=1296120 RepID=A0A1B9GIH7_9TREE|nr:membrane transporter [Kwoniella heveanensis BCC8398]OCF41118.1 membrane transporter [Kwoniella heveanensis CBS 569]
MEPKDEKTLVSATVVPADNLANVEAANNVEAHRMNLSEADDAAAFVAGFHGEIDPKEAARVRRKIDWNLLPLMMILYFVQFSDKTTLGSSSILGIKTSNHLTTSQYNWLGTIFYLSYLIFEWPQSLALQRFPAGKWMAGNIIIWGVVVTCQAACNSFAGLFVCRLIMGICEGTITAGFLIVTSMFYTHIEATRRVGFWFLMNGTAQIISGLIAFGVYHIDADKIAPWRVFMIIFGLITLVVGVCFWIFIPDSPMKARFLTHEEKIIAIERLRGHNSGIENKTWKKEQFIEALTDWKPWAFAIFAALDNVPNSLTNQSSLIIKSFGFTTEQTTLLGCVSGVIEILTIYSATWIIKKVPNCRGIVGAAYFIPNIVGSIMIIALPWSNKGGLLCGIYLTGLGTSGFVLALSWCAATNTGHTKKTTTNAMLLIGYCVGNLVAPQMWLAKYSPRYYVPWGIILACYIVCPLIMLAIAWALWRENKRRDRLTATGEIVSEKYYDEQGEEIDPTFLDITDRVNMSYRYPL